MLRLRKHIDGSVELVFPEQEDSRRSWDLLDGAGCNTALSVFQQQIMPLQGSSAMNAGHHPVGLATVLVACFTLAALHKRKAHEIAEQALPKKPKNPVYASIHEDPFWAPSLAS